MKKESDSFLLEICCYSAADVLIANQAGAHRVELCSGYEVGGTTPSIGTLIRIKSECDIPVYVMIRPRGGNFYYSELEKKIMLLDIEASLKHGANGIVFGALDKEGNIDESFCHSVMHLCGKVPVTFHRAIDVCNNYIEAVDFLAASQVKCILTSGRANKAIDGIKVIKEMHVASKNKIDIMVGSGVNSDNILSFAKIGITHFHSSASVIAKHHLPQHNYQIGFNANLHNNELSVVTAEKIGAMLTQLNIYDFSNS
jgi:copper homeostasis protein